MRKLIDWDFYWGSGRERSHTHTKTHETGIGCTRDPMRRRPPCFTHTTKGQTFSALISCQSRYTVLRSVIASVGWPFAVLFSKSFLHCNRTCNRCWRRIAFDEPFFEFSSQSQGFPQWQQDLSNHTTLRSSTSPTERSRDRRLVWLMMIMETTGRRLGLFW